MLVPLDRLVLTSDERSTPLFSLQVAWDIILCHLRDESCYADREFSPIVISQNYSVIDGFRRVVAARVLKLEYIEVEVADEGSPVQSSRLSDPYQFVSDSGTPLGASEELAASYN